MKKITYDPDAMDISIQKGECSISLELDKNVILDLDKNGKILGIEILFVKKRNPKILESLKPTEILTA